MARTRENNFLRDFEDTGLQPSLQQTLAQTPVVQQPSMAKQPTMATDKTSIIDNLVKQIQARSNTSQWSGGVGADQATKDMARILAETGITDISQFGPITREVQKVVGYEDWGELAPVDPLKVISGSIRQTNPNRSPSSISNSAVSMTALIAVVTSVELSSTPYSWKTTLLMSVAAIG